MIELPPQDARAIVKKWQGEIDRSKRYFEKWNKDAKRIVKRYRGERPDHVSVATHPDGARFNLFWSMTETFKGFVYSRTPKPDVTRRWKDDNKTASIASDMLEKACSFQLTCQPFDDVIEHAVTDYLLTGRGMVWVRYEPDIETTMGVKIVSWETAAVDFVEWGDFLHQPAKTWETVSWVARKVMMRKPALLSRFGDAARDVECNYVDGVEQKDSNAHDAFKQTLVWEIWDRSTRQAIWIADGYADAPLDIADDPLRLQGFFPCPKPLYGTMTTGSTIPVPDYCQMADQFEELDDITRRIMALTSALKNIGLGDASIPELQRLLKEGADNVILPVENWRMFMDKGGMQGALQWMPLENVVTALTHLYTARDQVRDTIYEVSGMADVIRGVSDPQETATAQRLKGKWASIRVSRRQDDVQEFCRDIVRIVAEIIAEHFQPETLVQMTGTSLPTGAEKAQMMQAAMFAQANGQPLPPAAAAAIKQPSVDDIVGLLRSDKLRSYMIEIETDSTIEPDEQQDKADRIELVRAMSEVFASFLPVVEKAPALAPAVKELMMFTIRGFKAGRSIEESFETALDAAVDQAMQAHGQPDAETMLAQGTLQIEGAKVQQKAQADAEKARLKDKEIMVDAATAAEKLRVDEAKAKLSATTAREKNITAVASRGRGNGV